MFEAIHQDLGILTARQKLEIIYNYKGELDITSISAGCGCTQSHWDKENKRIIITFTPSHIPPHLYVRGKRSYVTEKKVDVTTRNKGNFTLTFTGIVKEPCYHEDTQNN